MNNTDAQYESALGACKDIFLKKTSDYGTSWRVLRPISIVDQLFIKAQRIRTLQERKQRKVDEDIRSEFIGMVNYGIIGLIQLHDDYNPEEEIPVDKVKRLYEDRASHVRQVMENKNHDYGEAWRDMSQESFADLILMKLMRMKQILANQGKTLISEGIDANYTDIINYSLFALILIEEGKHST
jgi:hypothetical protein